MQQNLTVVGEKQQITLTRFKYLIAVFYQSAQSTSANINAQNIIVFMKKFLFRFSYEYTFFIAYLNISKFTLLMSLPTPLHLQQFYFYLLQTFIAKCYDVFE